MSDEWENESVWDEGVRLTVNRTRIAVMSQSATAPEKMRIEVKLAASIPVWFSANRQRSELLAKAIIAANVRMKIRLDLIGSS
jgi:hypothetical protein